MKTTLLPDLNYILSENHIHFYNESGNITHSTLSMKDVKQLDRTLFVKKEDVEELAEKHVLKQGYNKNNHKALFQHINEKNNFIAGYNANKGEFSREEMERAIKFGANYAYAALEPEKFINNLRPLSLPKSIIVDESYNITKVNW